MLYIQDATSLLHVINDMPHTMAGWGRLSVCVCVLAEVKVKDTF